MSPAQLRTWFPSSFLPRGSGKQWSAGENRANCAVGKTTIFSYWNNSTATPFLEDPIAQLGRLLRARFLFLLVLRRVCSARLCGPSRAKPRIFTLPNVSSNTAVSWLASKLLSFRELASAIKQNLLTKVNSAGYRTIRKGVSRGVPRAQGQRVSVPGTLVSGERTRVLTAPKQSRCRVVCHRCCGRFPDPTVLAIAGISSSKPLSPSALLLIGLFLSEFARRISGQESGAA